MTEERFSKKTRLALYETLCQMGPLTVQVELTEACNLKCKFCYNSQQPRYSQCSIEVLERLHMAGTQQIVLTGGEPVVHPQFLDIARRAAEMFPVVTLKTNGTMLDDKTIGELERINVAAVNVSLHGSKEVHESLTETLGSYEPAMAAIERLAKSRIHVETNTVITSANFRVIKSLLEDLYGKGVKTFGLTRFTAAGIGKRNRELSLSKEMLVDALLQADVFLSTRANATVSLSNAVPLCFLPASLRKFSKGCSAGSASFYVDIDGNLMHCGMLREKLGSVREQDLQSIKRSSSTYRKFAINECYPSDCLGCEQFLRCHGGCRAAAVEATGRLDGKDPFATSPCT